jgi:hypothetical protein
VSEASLRVVAHGTVENPRRLDTARDKSKTHIDPPQDFTLDDFIDIINPLQHLPLVSILYREITGDEIKPAMRILGDIGYGGPTGFLSSVGQVLFEAVFGDDMAGTAIAMFTGEDDEKASVQLAATDPSTPLPAAPAKADATYAEFTIQRGSHR